MEPKNEATKTTQEELHDPGTSLIVGGIFCLAAYGLYKLIKQEAAPPQPMSLPDRSNDDLARLVLQLEKKS